MDLVKTEITRLNGEVANRGSMSMVFHSGGVHVSIYLAQGTLAFACLVHSLLMGVLGGQGTVAVRENWGVEGGGWVLGGGFG